MNFNNPYYNPVGYNSYQQMYRQPIQQMQPIQPIQQSMQSPNFLQGKLVDSIDVVKATDIPLDGSVSYFPIADGSLIATKQLQMDGTTKICVYKPIIENEAVSQVQANNITINDLDDCMKKYDNSVKFEELSKQIEDLKNALKVEKAKK